MNEFPSPDPPPSERPFWRRPRSALLVLAIALVLVFGVVAAMPLLAAQGTSSHRAASSGSSQASQGATSTGQAQGTPTHTPHCPVVANPVASCFTCPSTAQEVACPPCPTNVPQREPPCANTQPPPPPVKSPTISFCPGSPIPIVVGPGSVQLRGTVCGKGFHPGEVVNFLATGRGSHMAWHVTADSSGNLVSQVPPLLCQLAPLTLVATGNKGSRSNALSLTNSDCQPRL